MKARPNSAAQAKRPAVRAKRDRLRKNRGFTYPVSGRPYRALELAGPLGACVVVLNPDLDEHLAPSMVTYLQRRLGVKSPFSATPEQPNPSETEYVQESGVPFDPAQKGEPKK